ncbi:MAG: membrane protein insertase YidC, partial [Campylobacterales bacterium]|nr:membrane protein insertase YidC [Campylobacterales bacterium]
MIDKLSPNQRLLLAVVLSVVFFVVYTAIFSPEQKVEKDVKKSEQVELKTETTPSVENVVGHTISDAEKVQSSASSTIVTVNSKDFILKIDTLGRISSMELLEDKYKNKDGGHAQLISPNGTKPMYLRFLDEELNKEATQVPYISSVKEVDVVDSAKKIVLTQNLSNMVVTKELTIYPDGHYDAKVNISQNQRYFIYLGQRPKVNNSEQMMVVTGAMVYTDDDIVTIVEDGEAEGRKTFSGVKLISAFDQYSASIMYGFSKDTNIMVERDRDNNPIVYFEAMPKMQFSGYVGQKDYKTLKNIDPMLTNAIEYGWFTFAAKPIFALLSWLHGIFGNWGWAIIGLTILIRLVLYPLTYKGMMSMQKIKEISPKIKELQAKYKGDPQRMNAAVMDMYKKHNANPLGGCLPMLLQIPVFFA